MSKFPEKPFVNRLKEQNFLHKHFASIPDHILWISGPKSCGKSHLISKVIKELDQEKYAINYLNLRGALIYNFQSFLDVFFQKDESIKEKAGRIIGGLSVSIGFFSVNLNDDAMLKKNAFKVMEDQIRQAKDDGIQPIIILDEIQTLKDIYLNGERKLIDEVFNLFVRLTKETHLAHIVCMTSDSYFMEEIFNNSKLVKTSQFYHIEHFDQITTENWLKEEGLKEEEIAMMYDYFGGSPWDIWQVLVAFKRGDDTLHNLCEEMLLKHFGQIVELRNYLYDNDLEVFDEINKSIVKNNVYIRHDKENKIIINELIKKCIEKDIWFYRAETKKITPNSKVMQKAMERIN